MPDYMPSVWTSIFKVQGVLYLLIPHLVKLLLVPEGFDLPSEIRDSRPVAAVAHNR